MMVSDIILSFPSLILIAAHYLCADFQSQLERVEVVLRTLLQFCQRNSVRADEKSRQAMWLPMFDQLLGMLYQCQDTPTNLLQGDDV